MAHEWQREVRLLVGGTRTPILIATLLRQGNTASGNHSILTRDTFGGAGPVYAF